MTYEHLSNKLTQEEYLRERIDHYDENLSSVNSFGEYLSDFILELRTQCKRELRKIKETDMEATLMANASACHSHFMNSIS